MKIYLEIITTTEGKTFEQIYNLFEKYNIKFERFKYYSTDIKLLRKIKISKIEGSSKFDKLINILFDTNIIKFIEKIPSFNSNMNVTSGTCGVSGPSIPSVTEECEQLLLEYKQLKQFFIENNETQKEHIETHRMNFF